MSHSLTSTVQAEYGHLWCMLRSLYYLANWPPSILVTWTA
jgi:hypothetical protein